MKPLYKSTNELDLRAIREFGLTEEILMENASSSIEHFIRKKFKKKSLILGIVGSGNNGADVLGSLRMLCGDYKCIALIVGSIKKNNLHINRAEKSGVKIYCINKDFLDNSHKNIKLIDPKKKWFDKFDCIVDGIFGSGLNKNIQDYCFDIIKKVNKSKAYRLACDVPSGLDKDGIIRGICFNANSTICMGALKIGLYSDMAKDFVGKVTVANLGISFVNFKTKTKSYLLEKNDIKLPTRKLQNTNKGSYGHVFAIVGKKDGAAKMALLAASCVGAGLVSAISDCDISLPMHIMKDNKISQKMNVGIVGPGIGIENVQRLNFDDFKHKILVVDADMFYDDCVLDLASKKQNVLTPHPKEFASLLSIAGIFHGNTHEIQLRRFELACKFSELYPATLVLKGSNTIIAKNGKIFIMPFGSPALAKGGSGDVLAGIIAGLLAQGYKPLKAAKVGTLIHAFASRKFKKHSFCLKPQDIIKGIKCLEKK